MKLEDIITDPDIAAQLSYVFKTGRYVEKQRMELEKLKDLFWEKHKIDFEILT